jgi:hypothetical protein
LTQTLNRNSRFALGATTALAILGAIATTAKADGTPVVSLEMTTIGPMRIPVYTNRPSGVVSAPVSRVITNGNNTDIEYDASAPPRMVVTRPGARIVGSGENQTVEYDDAAAAHMPHSMPTIGMGHNPGLTNLETLPSSLR